MKIIRTVLGDMEAGKAGFCQCHEHLMLRKGPAFFINPALRMEDEEKSAAEVKCFADSGGGTLVDAQPLGCGRMERELQSISRRTGVHIVASTGFHKKEFYPKDHWIFQKDEKELCRIFTEELENGMFENCDGNFSGKQMDGCAGQIKVALEDADSFKNDIHRFRAAVRTGAETGRSIMVHTEKGSPVREFLSLCAAYGIQGKQVAVCHMDRTFDSFTEHLRTLETGVFLEYDTIGRRKYHSDRQEAEMILKLLDEGYCDQLLLSLDTTAARMKAYDKEGIGLDYLQTVFLPRLKHLGVTQENIETVTKENGQRYLGGK